MRAPAGSGKEVATASSGRDALALFRAGQRYDLVLCDVGMPEMTGWQVAEAIRALAPGARIHLLTGWAAEIPSNDPGRRFVDGILPKPLQVQEVHRLLLPPSRSAGEPAGGLRLPA